MKIKHKCEGVCYDRVTHRGGYYGCNSNASVNEDGKWWCKRHAPSLVKAKQAKQARKWHEASERQNRIHELEQACVAFTRASAKKHPQAADIIAELDKLKKEGK